MRQVPSDSRTAVTVSVAVGGKKFLPTVNLTGDYVGPAPLGSWVEGKGRLVRTTRSLGFAEALITADGAPAVRTSGIMKIPSQESRVHDYRHACPQQFPGQIMETGEGSLCGFRAV